MKNWISQEIYYRQNQLEQLKEDLKILKQMQGLLERIDAKKYCKDCGGKGKTKDYYEFPDFNFVKCETCNGTGKPTKKR